MRSMDLGKDLPYYKKHQLKDKAKVSPNTKHGKLGVIIKLKREAMYQTLGGCHCKNITFEIKSSKKFDAYEPRACDCEFCSKHSASYISDPKGTLKIVINNEKDLKKYKVGSGVADFLICNNCGVFVSVCYEEQDCIYGSINSKTVDRKIKFGNEVIISPEQLSDSVKIKRWKDIWFSNVQIVINKASY